MDAKTKSSLWVRKNTSLSAIFLQFRCLTVIAALAGLLPSSAPAADFDGVTVDSVRYSAFARSLRTGRYYPATVVFQGDHAIVDLNTNKKLDLTLEQKTIDDPEEILASDAHGVWWALSVDDIDGPPSPNEPAPVSLIASAARKHR